MADPARSTTGDALPIGGWRLTAALRRGSVARRYATAVLGQATLGGFNFALAVVLVRALDAPQYGAWALTFVVATLALSVNNALVAGPLVVFGTARAGSPSRRAVEALLSTVAIIVAAAVFALSVPLLAVFLDEPLPVRAAAASFLAAYVLRSYTRAFAYARTRPETALAGDLVTISAAAAALAAGWWLAGALSLPLVFGALAFGNVAGMTAEIRALGLRVRLVGGDSLRRYAAIWRHVRWSLVGATTTLLQSQAHSFLITIAYGAAAFAPIAAGQVLFGPLRIVMMAWHSILQPEAVLAIRRDDRPALARILAWSPVGLAGVVVAVGGLLVVFWEPLFHLLYAPTYADAPMAAIVAGWCAITFCAALWTAPSGVLQTLRRYRLLALGTVWGSAISVAGAGVAMLTLGPAWSLLGILVGEAFLVVYATLAVRRAMRGRLHPEPDAA